MHELKPGDAMSRVFNGAQPHRIEEYRANYRHERNVASYGFNSEGAPRRLVDAPCNARIVS
jgi:hypothetical protein